MKLLTDYQNKSILLTRERLSHIMEHPEMAGMEKSIEETLINPEYVVQSISDSKVNLYYRFYYKTRIGGKFLCVVVKFDDTNSFILTSYLTDKIKKGVILWKTKKI